MDCLPRVLGSSWCPPGPLPTHLTSLRSWALVLEWISRAVLFTRPHIHHRSAGASGSQITSLDGGQHQPRPAASPEATYPSDPEGATSPQEGATQMGTKSPEVWATIAEQSRAPGHPQGTTIHHGL